MHELDEHVDANRWAQEKPEDPVCENTKKNAEEVSKVLPEASYLDASCLLTKEKTAKGANQDRKFCFAVQSIMDLVLLQKEWAGMIFKSSFSAV